MLRMEIALFMVLAFVACVYFSAGRKSTPLHRTFSALLVVIGVNFLAYLTNIRMEKAKKLLLSTSLSIAEVAEQSGYGDYRVFTKVFKKSEGITPSQYRRDFLVADEGEKR